MLMGTSVLCWTRSELKVLQNIENGMWQMMLGAPGYAPVSTLQGEVRTSGIVARDIKLKFGYQKYLINCENEPLHEIYEDVMQNMAGDWNRTMSAQ